MTQEALRTPQSLDKGDTGMDTKGKRKSGLSGADRSIQLTQAQAELTLQTYKDALAKMADYKRRQGGVTPAQLQEMVGAVAEVVNPGFEVISLVEYLEEFTNGAVRLNDHEATTTVQEFAGGLALVLMHFSSIYAFDLNEVAYLSFEAHLENQINRLEGYNGH